MSGVSLTYWKDKQKRVSHKNEPEKYTVYLIYESRLTKISVLLEERVHPVALCLGVDVRDVDGFVLSAPHHCAFHTATVHQLLEHSWGQHTTSGGLLH